MTRLLASLEFKDALIITAILWLLVHGSIVAARLRGNSRRLERKLDALLKHHGVEYPSGMSLDVQQLAKDPAKKIAAIKLHREDHPGLGLAEAKDEIEDFIESMK